MQNISKEKHIQQPSARSLNDGKDIHDDKKYLIKNLLLSLKETGFQSTILLIVLV